MLRRVNVLPVIMLTLLSSIHTQGVEAASFIRVVEDEGIWWFEDGRGQRFFSLGVNCIGGCFGHAEESPMEDSRKRWIVGRLMEQGFNTAASWSSPSLWDHFYVSDQIYTGFREEQDDVFDDSLWKGRLEPCIREEVKPFFGKTNFIGYFIDNEPKWNAANTFNLYLGLPAQRAGSRAFIAFLESYYEGSIAKLNGEWGRSYRAFGDIPSSFCPTAFPSAMEKGVLRAWRNEVAKTYCSRYVALLRSLDPDHLIMGVRYRGIPDLDLFKSLSPYFDVNSVNDYNRYGNLKPDFETLYKASGKPLMITEFSFSGFPESGHRSMLFVDVYSQENRGVGYEKSVLGAARTHSCSACTGFSGWTTQSRMRPTGDSCPTRTLDWSQTMKHRLMRSSGNGSNGPIDRFTARIGPHILFRAQRRFWHRSVLRPSPRSWTETPKSGRERLS